MNLSLHHLFRMAFLLAVVTGTHLATAPIDAPGSIGLGDKAAHFLGFVGLAFLLDFSFPESRYGFWLHKVPLLMAYGAAIEAIQYFLPHRQFSLADFGADVAGILVYFYLLLPLVRHLPVLRRRWNDS